MSTLPEPDARAIAEAWAKEVDAGRIMHKAIWQAGIDAGRTREEDRYSESIYWERLDDRTREFDKLAAIEIVTEFLAGWFHGI